MKALVFAAGLGTRLRPLTDHMPKAMVPVAGEPLLGHVLDRLAEGLGPCLTEAVVNVHHFPDQIISYLSSRDWSVPVKVSDERDFLRDTGGGLLYAEPLLRPSDDERILVHNVDILSNLDLGWFCEQAPMEALATLVVSDRPTRRYFLFREEPDPAGSLSRLRLAGWTNIETGEVRTPFPELDVAACRRLAFAGIHLVSPRIFDAFRALGFAPSADGAPVKFSITDFYLAACARYPIYGIVPAGFRMMDVGKIDTLAAAADFLG